MDKKVLIIMNPRSGTMRANKYLTDITEMFVLDGYMPTVLITTKRGDGTEYAKKYAADYDLLVAIGGDGTFNEVAAGVVESGCRVPLGYIPAGTTNDFANSLELSKDVIHNAKSIIGGKVRPIDLGSFNGRNFSYIASFGAFTKASYSTPQSVKNMFGHTAYVLAGVKEVASLRPIHMSIEADGQLYEGDYLMGAISNSTSVAGLLTIKREYVDLSDGMFELLLIKAPKDPMELAELVHMLSIQNFYETSMITFVNAKEFHIRSSSDISLTLDGEFQEGAEEIYIKNLEGAIDMVLPEKKAESFDRFFSTMDFKYGLR
jgi:YegS/Rv2252/BmrU family lipid kinase